MSDLNPTPVVSMGNPFSSLLERSRSSDLATSEKHTAILELIQMGLTHGEPDQMRASERRKYDRKVAYVRHLESRSNESLAVAEALLHLIQEF